MKFLSKQKNCFTWPSKEDSFTYLENEILCKLEPLIPSSNYRDKYQLSQESYKKSCELFAEIYVAILGKVSFQSVFYF